MIKTNTAVSRASGMVSLAEEGFKKRRRCKMEINGRKISEVEFNRILILGQVISLFVLGGTFLFYLVVEWFWPDFFNPRELWCRTDSIFAAASNFWPLFAWGGLMALISCSKLGERFHAKELLITNSITSVLAGVWEELGFRCLFIFTGMIAVAFSNWAWFFIILFIFGILTLTILGKAEGIAKIWAILPAGIIVLFFWLDLTDPIYWLYQSVIFPVLNFISAGYLEPILYKSGMPFLFVAGAVSANAKFRDGHKYQGLFGVLNAWVIGFIMIYAMLTYGLVVAILCHVAYDLEFALIRYFGRKIKGTELTAMELIEQERRKSFRDMLKRVAEQQRRAGFGRRRRGLGLDSSEGFEW
jgi:hypothetical protein